MMSMQLYKNLKLLSSAMIVIVAFSCKSAKNVIASGEASDKLSACDEC